jgi:pimeloyl-ACP methyl ester carboxylesterase
MSDDYREFRYASADGVDLFCREYRAPSAHRTVVCLPGLTRNSRDFTNLARQLSTRYRVLTPDLRGRGFSSWDANPANYQPPVYFQDVFKLIAEQSRDALAIIGTSLGGILAMALAATAPTRIAGIVLNDVGPQIEAGALARIGQYVGLRTRPGTWPEALAQSRTNYGSAYPDLDEAGWLDFTRRSYREDDAGVVVADYDPAIGDALRATQSTTFDLWPVWAGLAGKPVLVIRGARSDVLSTETVERMAREKPDLERFEVANRGHAPLLDEPGVLPAIDAFLGRVLP